jgi:hypothetical protein
MEASIMTKFEHENVMKVIGISLDKYCNPEIILPFMKKGDLLSYIKNINHKIHYMQVSYRFESWGHVSWEENEPNFSGGMSGTVNISLVLENNKVLFFTKLISANYILNFFRFFLDF